MRKYIRERFTRYVVALVPAVLTALFAGLAITAEPQVIAGPKGGLFDFIYRRWTLVGVALTAVMIIAFAIGDIRRSLRHHGR